METLGFTLIVFLSFSLASASIKALRAACTASKWLAIISLLVFPSNTGGGLSMKTEEKLKFLPNTNCFGLKP